MPTMKPTRRTFLLTAAAGALSAAGAAAITQTANGTAAQSKALVIYFSRTGTTRQLAQMIGRAVEAPLLELILREPYAQEYGAMTDIARSERASGARREIATTIPDLSGYDTIYLGSPYWWGGISIPVRTFLQDHPLAGKRAVRGLGEFFSRRCLGRYQGELPAGADHRRFSYRGVAGFSLLAADHSLAARLRVGLGRRP